MSSSPYMLDTDPMEETLYDIISPISCQSFAKAYSGNYDPKTLASPHYSPLNATSLAGLPPMLVFIGGLEVLRPSIEKLVAKAKGDKCSVDVVLHEGRPHCWFFANPTCTPQDRAEAIETCANFLIKHSKKNS